MPAKNILMLVGDYVEDYEVMVPFQALQMVGHTVHAACPGKKKGDKVRTAIHDFALNATFADVKAADYDALVLPGGRAPEYLRLDAKVLDCVRHFFTTGKPVAAICHAIQILVTADVLKGRVCTAYPAVGPDVKTCGGSYEAIGIDKAITDKNLVTAPAWPAHPDWLAQFLKVLGTRIG